MQPTRSALIKTVRFAALFLLIGFVAVHHQSSKLLRLTPDIFAQSQQPSVNVVFDAYIKNNTPTSHSYSFGYPMAMSGDTLAVAQFNDLSIFRRTAQGTWQKEAQITIPNPLHIYEFPSSIALEGDRLLIGDPDYTLQQGDNDIFRAGTVYIYERDNNNSWQLQGQLFAPSSWAFGAFGFALDLSGDTAIVSSMGTTEHPGAFTIFRRNQEGQWIQEFHKEAPEANVMYAFDVAIDQDLIAISNLQDGEFLGAPYFGHVLGHQHMTSQQKNSYVEVYRRSGSTWQLESTLYSHMADSPTFDSFGYSLDIDNETIVVGAPTDENELFGVNPEITSSVGTSPQLGAAYIFEQASPGDWSKITYLKANSYSPNAAFGHTVVIEGNKVLVGVPFHSNSNWNYQGAAHLFVKTADGWQDAMKIVAPNPDTRDYFGYMAVLSGEMIAISAIHEASGATGINGDQTDNSAPASGAVYTFVIEENSPPDEGEDPPNNGGTPPDTGENPPNEGENPPDEGENPPDEGENPPDNGEQPVQDGDFKIDLPLIRH